MLIIAIRGMPYAVGSPYLRGYQSNVSLFTMLRSLQIGCRRSTSDVAPLRLGTSGRGLMLNSGNGLTRVKSNAAKITNRRQEWLDGGRFLRSSPPGLSGWEEDYFKLSLVRSTESLAMNVAPHQLEAGPPWLAVVKNEPLAV